MKVNELVEGVRFDYASYDNKKIHDYMGIPIYMKFSNHTFNDRYNTRRGDKSKQPRLNIVHPNLIKEKIIQAIKELDRTVFDFELKTKFENDDLAVGDNKYGIIFKTGLEKQRHPVLYTLVW